MSRKRNVAGVVCILIGLLCVISGIILILLPMHKNDIQNVETMYAMAYESQMTVDTSDSPILNSGMAGIAGAYENIAKTLELRILMFRIGFGALELIGTALVVVGIILILRRNSYE